MPGRAIACGCLLLGASCRGVGASAGGEALLDVARVVGDYHEGTAPIRIETGEGIWLGYTDRSGYVVLDHERRICNDPEWSCENGVPVRPVPIDRLDELRPLD